MSNQNRNLYRRTLQTALRPLSGSSGTGQRDPAVWDELDDMQRMGWGSTPQIKIPSDWRSRRGPDRVGPDLVRQESGGVRK